jgi:hypothetical protein
MPLCQSSGSGFYEKWLGEILRCGDLAGNVTIKHAIFEPGEQLGRKTMPHEQFMVGSFSLPINEDGSSITVGAKQNGLLVDFRLGKTRPAVHCLQKGIGDAICESHELDAGISMAPFRNQSQNQLQG